VHKSILYIGLFSKYHFKTYDFTFYSWIFWHNEHYIPNLETEIHDSAPSSHSWALRKIIIEPAGAIHVLRKPPQYEHSTYSKNPISRFGYMWIISIWLHDQEYAQKNRRMIA